MKKFFLFLTAILFVLTFSGVASAVPWTWTDTFSPENPVKLTSENNWYQYTHSIVDEGFDPLQDFVYSADLKINLYDDGDVDRLKYGLIPVDFEYAEIELDLALFDQSQGVYEIDYTDLDLGVSVLGLAYLNLTGDLVIEIEQWGGDFWFGGSILTANGNETAPVPEPATMLLLGTGLVGLAVGSRKKFFKK